MSNITFTVRKVFPGTESQKKIGIHATFNMTIDGPDGIIASVNDMKLRQSREGKYYLESPFRTYDTTDRQTGQAKTQKISFVKFFPEEKNWSKQDAIVSMVMQELGNASTAPARPTQKTAYNKPNTSRPQMKAPSPPVQEEDSGGDIW